MDTKTLILIGTVVGSLVGPPIFAADSSMETLCVKVDERPFWVRVAETPEQQEQGLKGQTRLRQHEGMLFPFDSSQILTFWMKDCKIPLDILFFNRNRLVGYVESAPPCDLPDAKCPRYRSQVPADKVIELKAGTIRKYQLSPQSRLTPCTAAQDYKP